MTDWIGLGSAEGVQPANGTPMLPTVETVVRWQTKANMDITLEHPIHTKTPVFGKRKRKREMREKEESKGDGKTKKKPGKNYKVFGLGWGHAMIDVSIVPTELYIHTFLLLFFLSSRTGSIIKNRWSGSCITWHKNSRCCPLLTN